MCAVDAVAPCEEREGSNAENINPAHGTSPKAVADGASGDAQAGDDAPYYIAPVVPASLEAASARSDSSSASLVPAIDDADMVPVKRVRFQDDFAAHDAKAAAAAAKEAGKAAAAKAAAAAATAAAGPSVPRVTATGALLSVC